MDATLGKKFTILCQSLFLNLFQEATITSDKCFDYGNVLI